jgi:hypothetical protein
VFQLAKAEKPPPLSSVITQQDSAASAFAAGIWVVCGVVDHVYSAI